MKKRIAPLDELEQKILNQELQINSIKEELNKTTSFEKVKDEIMEKTRMERKEQIRDIVKVAIWLFTIFLTLFSLFVGIVGTLGYKDLRRAFLESNERDAIIAKNQEYNQAAIKIKLLIDKGNAISKHYPKDTAKGRQDFANWKNEVVDFLTISGVVDQVNIDYIHDKHVSLGDDWKESIKATNISLEAVIKKLETQIRPVDKNSE